MVIKIIERPALQMVYGWNGYLCLTRDILADNSAIQSKKHQPSIEICPAYDNSNKYLEMKLFSYIQTIQIHLIKTHSDILLWFNESPDVKSFRPLDNGWTISEILEHIALTSHFLMILIDKGADKALQNLNHLALETLIQNFDFDLTKIEQIGMHKSFGWIRPEHMEPQGVKSELEIKDELIGQLNRCLTHLEKLKNGEGLIHKTTMTVNALGKINVYEYIYFLSKHAERHIAQMEENRAAFHLLSKGSTI